jgi:hypothetical protein
VAISDTACNAVGNRLLRALRPPGLDRERLSSFLDPRERSAGP